jgi:hypothetical protein
MDRRYLLYRDIFGSFYQILSPYEPPHPGVKRRDFFCPVLTATFMRTLKVPPDFWHRYADDIEYNYLSGREGDIAALESVAKKLVHGTLAIYKFPDLNSCLGLRDGKGARFSFARGPVPLPTDKELLSFTDEAEINEHLAGMKSSANHWHDLLQENGLLTQNIHPRTTRESEYRNIIKKHLLSGELLLYKTHDAPAPPKAGESAQLENAVDAPGNRPAHLIEPPMGPPRNVEAKKVKATQEEACDELGKSEVSEAEAAEKGGIDPEHMDAIKKVCKKENAVVSFRKSNPDCIPHMKNGVKSKGLKVKQKTFTKESLPESHKEQAGLVSTLMKKPGDGEILSGDQLMPYKTKNGEPLTGDYDMHEMIDATSGERIMGETDRDLDLRKALNAKIGSKRIMHGSQAGYMEYCEKYGEEPKPELMQPDPPVTVVDGKEPVTFYQLDSDEQLLNMYNCKGTEVPSHWNFQSKASGA